MTITKSDVVNGILKQHPKLSRTRNFGVIAHVDAGKTTTTERILLYTGEIRNTGEVHDGQATTDFREDEKERGVTIQSAAVSCNWKVKDSLYNYNIIDTPGHIDFNIEVEKSLRVLDGAILVIDGKEGVQTQTKKVFSQANKYDVPLICFVNKMDGMGANYDRSCRTLGDRLGANYIKMQVPVGDESNFMGVIDIIEKKYYHWEFEDKKPYEIREVPENLMDQMQQTRSDLLDTLAEFEYHQEFMDRYLEHGDNFSPQEIRDILRVSVLKGDIMPTFCGSAFKNRGVEIILDAISQYLPNPVESCALLNAKEIKYLDKVYTPEEKDVKVSSPHFIDGTVSVSTVANDFVGLVFDTMVDKFGTTCFVRIYSGRLPKGGMKILHTRTNKSIMVRKYVKIFAQKREDMEESFIGDIIGLKNVSQLEIGDTITGISNKGLGLMCTDVPAPVISMAIVPKNNTEKTSFIKALKAIQKKDISLHVSIDSKSGNIVISGMGELHLDVIVNQIARELEMNNITTQEPRIEYAETITQEVLDFEHEHKKQTGGSGQYAKMKVHLIPMEIGSGLQFESKITGGTIDTQYIKVIEKTFKDFLVNEGGVLAKYPVKDIKMILIDGAMHSVDTSSMAFENATRSLLRDALIKGAPTILEPIMKLEIDNVPSGKMSNDVQGDVAKRRGIVKDHIQSNNGKSRIVAEVPMRELLSYVSYLRGKTKGDGQSSMSLLCYKPVTESYIVDEIIKNVS